MGWPSLPLPLRNAFHSFMPAGVTSGALYFTSLSFNLSSLSSFLHCFLGTLSGLSSPHPSFFVADPVVSPEFAAFIPFCFFFCLLHKLEPFLVRPADSSTPFTPSRALFFFRLSTFVSPWCLVLGIKYRPPPFFFFFYFQQAPSLLFAKHKMEPDPSRVVLFRLLFPMVCIGTFSRWCANVSVCSASCVQQQ